MPGPRPSKRLKKERAVKRQEKTIEKIERRGGFRPNAGGKPGPRSIAKRLMGVREITGDIIKSGKVPLRVMINNMIYYDEKAGFLEEQFNDAMADHIKSFSEKGFLKALELLAQVSDARMKSQKCAVDAAPFLHPRLSQISMDVTRNDAPRDLPSDASIDLARDDYRRMRSAPLVPQPQDDVIDVTPEPEESEQ